MGALVESVYASRGLELFLWRLVPQRPILSVYKKPYNIYRIFYTDTNRCKTRLRQSVDLTIDRKPHRPSQKEHIHECLANSLTCFGSLGNGYVQHGVWFEMVPFVEVISHQEWYYNDNYTSGFKAECILISCYMFIYFLAGKRNRSCVIIAVVWTSLFSPNQNTY